MRSKQGLVFLALLCALGAQAADVPLSKEEFDAVTAQPFKATNINTGTVVHLHLKSDGAVVASQGYNDVGTWRKAGESGYCLRWSKQRLDERCSDFMRRDGKTGLTVPEGGIGWWVEEIKK